MEGELLRRLAYSLSSINFNLLVRFERKENFDFSFAMTTGYRTARADLSD